MDNNTILQLLEVTRKCENTVKDVTNESDDISFAIGFEHGANLVISQIEIILQNQLIFK